MFQDTFGYYAQGVTPQTATLPEGWRERLIPYLTNNTNGVTAHCLEPHDLWISKAIAARSKDKEFCLALLQRNLVQVATLRQRLDMIAELDPAKVKVVTSFIDLK